MPEASLNGLTAERSSPQLKKKPSNVQKSKLPLSVDLSKLFAGQTSMLRIIGARFMRSPAKFIVYSALTCIGGAILVNATAMQSERHPAPFFAVAPASNLVTASIPLPPSRPASIRNTISEADLAKQAILIKDLQGTLARKGFYIGQIDGQMSNRFEIAIREFEKAASLPVSGEPSEKLLTMVAASKLTMKDQLLVLIKDSSAGASADKSKTNLQVQRALNKVGYGPVKEDGVYGATTKAAIELFEKSHKLAVRGEPNGRVLKELAAASGIAVE
jgi:peptidoglycan hydrolase-like protein with peptidoglycan-binding domain